jgi:hypothetical protein
MNRVRISYVQWNSDKDFHAWKYMNLLSAIWIVCVSVPLSLQLLCSCGVTLFPFPLGHFSSRKAISCWMLALVIDTQVAVFSMAVPSWCSAVRHRAAPLLPDVGQATSPFGLAEASQGHSPCTTQIPPSCVFGLSGHLPPKPSFG